MNFYLAARYSMRDQLRHYAWELRALGHVVTSSWLETDWPIGEAREGITAGSSAAPPMYRAEWALKDLSDVWACDVLVSFACQGGEQRGGRHVEFGYGLALDKAMILIGEPEHIFHEHPHVAKYPTWHDFYVTLALAPGTIKVKQALLFSHGMVAVYGEDGEQIPAFQGPYTDALDDKIVARSTPNTTFQGPLQGPYVWKSQRVLGWYTGPPIESEGVDDSPKAE